MLDLRFHVELLTKPEDSQRSQSRKLSGFEALGLAAANFTK